MRRTAPLLLAAALLAATGPAAAADPAAEVGPGSVDPGGSVTVSVSCDPLGGTAPETLAAASQAFADGTVELSRVAGDDDGVSGPAYRGTARIAAAADLEGETEPGGVGPDSAWTVDGTCPAPPGGQGAPWSATFDVKRNSGGTGGSSNEGGTADGDWDGDGGGTQPCTSSYGSSCGETGGGVQPCTPSHGSSCEDPGRACPAPQQPHGTAPHDSASHETAPHAPDPHATTCAPATVEHGVRAGAGGAFTDSVPALVAGGLLIAGAFGAAVHRLLLRRRPAADA